ncbi:hypothetical protein [Shimia biformata]|uniref:hypothetical protein n=1 Tax=Shimia biformata TaxID=1294299 RepID=UPI00194F4E9D|nr:hypothetical protein [Shimia biformata]
MLRNLHGTFELACPWFRLCGQKNLPTKEGQKSAATACWLTVVCLDATFATMSKERSNRNSTMRNLSEATVDGVAPLLGAGSTAADLMRFQDDELLTFLQVRLAQANGARRRARWFGGRWINRVTGEDPDAIVLSGIHLRHALNLIGAEIPEGLAARKQFRIPRHVAEAAVERLQASKK